MCGVPSRRCPRCGHERALDAFLSRRQVEHPWCEQCRRTFPVEAEHARAGRDARLKRGNPEAVLTGALPRCANPACPSGGVIPPEKVRKGQRFCSKHCLRMVRSGPERPCERMGCPNLLRKGQAHYCSSACRRAATYHPCQNPTCPIDRLLPPGRMYCSRACCVAHGMATGRFHRMSAQGNAVQQEILSHTGHPPHYERRAEAVRRNNASTPPRRRVSRTGTAYGYQVLFEPEEAGYRARMPALAGVTASGRTMHEAMQRIRAILREGTR